MVETVPLAAPLVKQVQVPVAAPVPVPHVVASPPVQAVQPVVQVAQPVVQTASVPIVTAQTADLTNSQFHAQDDIGQYNYGYSSPTSTKQELKVGIYIVISYYLPLSNDECFEIFIIILFKTADGVTRGSYSYVDANGLVQTVNYISDALGFKESCQWEKGRELSHKI